MNLLIFEELRQTFEKPAQNIFQPIVQAYFNKLQEKPDTFLSELQMLVSLPNSVNQFWHRDNTSPGISFTIPLHDTTLELGPTQIITSTHKSNAPDSSKVITASLQAGEVLAYDARLLHRGTKNNSNDVTRMAMAFRYDLTKTPPPGTTVIGTTITRVNGRAKYVLCRVRDALTGK
jgi:ectoine hydroxylase-related dioxygenase (phytanoyl-CoA dioxygenase family)